MQLKVVYIDDEAALCENFKDLHSTDEVVIETFTNPDIAIEQIRKNPPDVVFMDYRLPGTTGEQVATALNISQPIVLITGELEVKTSYPFYSIIQKSVDYDEVANAIEAFKKFKASKAA
jgi:two-component system LytT family response regulator